jgi:CMP-N,N'-diacetyllegionaminic acid synthase
VDVVSEERDRTRSRHRILGIIPARGGSKRIPRKNLYPLAGKPLIAYAIEAASSSRLLTRTIVSTDDAEIRRTAEAFGGDVPFLRPPELSGDQCPSVDFVTHALGELRDSSASEFDYVCIVEPTAPLRTTEDIDAALSMLLAEGTDSLIGLTPVEYSSPARLRVLRQSRVHLWAPEQWREGARQRDVEQVYRPGGGLFACRSDVILREHSLVGSSQCGFVLPPERGVDIDTYLDLAFAEFLMTRAPAR